MRAENVRSSAFLTSQQLKGPSLKDLGIGHQGNIRCVRGKRAYITDATGYKTRTSKVLLIVLQCRTARAKSLFTSRGKKDWRAELWLSRRNGRFASKLLSNAPDSGASLGGYLRIKLLREANVGPAPPERTALRGSNFASS